MVARLLRFDAVRGGSEPSVDRHVDTGDERARIRAEPGDGLTDVLAKELDAAAPSSG